MTEAGVETKREPGTKPNTAAEAHAAFVVPARFNMYKTLSRLDCIEQNDGSCYAGYAAAAILDLVRRCLGNTTRTVSGTSGDAKTKRKPRTKPETRA